VKQLGIVADEIHRDLAAAVRMGASLGLRSYEIRFLTTGRAPLSGAEELREVERIAAGEGVEITALSPGLKHVEDAAAFAHISNRTPHRCLRARPRAGRRVAA
jgi:sugar phosphate isomerase/epimerase